MTAEQEAKTIQDSTLTAKYFIKGTIHAVTGLHIGGSNLGLSIGGVDAVVLRNPFNNRPYLPGSSLKGKMRTLLERTEGKIGTKRMGAVIFGPYTNIRDEKTLIPRLFGITPEDNKVRPDDKEAAADQPISRLIVRDCHLTEDSFKRLDKMQIMDMPYTEVKTEVVIDRITSRAMPRQLERVPAGADFEMCLVLNLYKMDAGKEAAYLAKVFEALCLVQDDYLGGKGTRGSGEVKFKIKSVEKKTRENYEKGEAAQDITSAVTIPDDLKE